MLALRETPADGCEDVNGLIDGHIQQTARRIEELTQLLPDLKALRRACNGGHAARRCAIIAELGVSKGRAIKRRRPVRR